MSIKNELYNLSVSYFDFDVSEEQNQLLKLLCNFHVSQNQFSLFVLKGYAGTGKTSVVSAFVKALTEMKQRTVLLSPTGRAAKVFSLISSKPAFTIHKKIYRKEKVSGGAIQLNIAPNLHKYTLFLVDEASMISDYNKLENGAVFSRNLLEDLVNYVYNGKNCKMILIGDEGQLPPVGADYSPALDLNYLENNFSFLDFFSFRLNTVLRQIYDSDILNNATALRTASENAYPKFDLSGKNDLVALSGADLEDRLSAAYSESGETETLIITRSNKRANLFNQQIRARIFDYDENITVNDLLMVVRNNYFWVEENSPLGFIANGETIRVKRITGRETIYGFDFADAVVELVDYPSSDELRVKILLDVLDADTPNLPREKMKELFFKVEEDYAHEKNKKKRYELIMNDPYFNALQVKYSYAVTCHKSQGGQWETVFIDQGFLTEDMLDANYFRWLYTAFTRATKKLYLLNFSPRFFRNEK